MDSDMQKFLGEAVAVVPSPRQLAWFDREYYAFVHYGMNTYTNREWGEGDEDPALFNPTDLDCDEWVQTIKEAGMRGMILTAKHHDGFCLWPSAYTEHSVKNSPWRGGKGDVVREAAEACARGGIPFGIYLSPWDRNSPLYGTPEYNDYYCNQLTELLTGYGELFEVWFDGACGEGPNGKKQEYDFARYIALIRKYQPNAVIFNDRGPDVRWIGNEAGVTRAAEWAVVPHELCRNAEVQTGAGPEADGSLKGLYNTAEKIGGREQIVHSEGLCFVPSEADMSLRPGWFYHAEEEPHSIGRLMNTYFGTVGGNTTLLLNLSPMPSGRLDPYDRARLHRFGEILRDAFETPMAGQTCVRTDGGDAVCTLELTLPEADRVRYVVLQEDLTQGQRVEKFDIYNPDDADEPGRSLYDGHTIGHKAICPVNVDAKRLIVKVTAARACPVFRSATLFGFNELGYVPMDLERDIVW